MTTSGFIIFALLHIIPTLVIAEYMGKHRRIGYGRSVMWCLLLTPIIGFFVTYLSPKTAF